MLLNVALANLRLKVPLDAQVLPTFHILNHQAFFVRQVQQTNETVGSRDVGELGFRVDVREVVHDVCEHERARLVLGQDGDLGLLG